MHKCKTKHKLTHFIERLNYGNEVLIYWPWGDEKRIYVGDDHVHNFGKTKVCKYLCITLEKITIASPLALQNVRSPPKGYCVLVLCPCIWILWPSTYSNAALPFDRPIHAPEMHRGGRPHWPHRHVGAPPTSQQSQEANIVDWSVIVGHPHSPDSPNDFLTTRINWPRTNYRLRNPEPIRSHQSNIRSPDITLVTADLAGGDANWEGVSMGLDLLRSSSYVGMRSPSWYAGSLSESPT